MSETKEVKEEKAAPAKKVSSKPTAKKEGAKTTAAKKVTKPAEEKAPAAKKTTSAKVEKQASPEKKTVKTAKPKTVKETPTVASDAADEETLKVEASVASETQPVAAAAVEEEKAEVQNQEAPATEVAPVAVEGKQEEAPVEKAEIVEKEETTVPKVDMTPIEDDDFADTRGKQLEQERAIAEAKAAEEAAKKAEEEAKEKEEEEAEKEALPEHFEYDNDELQICETARKDFFKTYKTHSTVKTIVSFVFVLFFVLMWFLPQWVSALTSYTMLFTIIGAAVALVGVLVYSFFFKKKSQAWIHDYFSEFYGHQYNYVFSGCGLENAQGLVEMKLQSGEIENCGLYKDIVKVGSRYCYSFVYHGHDSFIIDAAAQVRNGKMLTPVFVGKLLKSKTTYEGSGIYMYFKGNKRALPPNGVSEYNILEETDKYVIYGAPEEKKYLTAERKNALKKIRTDKVLVDASVVLKGGNLSFYLGYEDSLMVVPMDKDFNPNPTKHFRDDMQVVLSIIDELNK